MSKKWLVIGGCALLTIIALGIHDYIGHQVRVACSASPGEQPSLAAQLQSLLSMAIAACGGIGAVAAFMHKWADALPKGKTKKIAVTLGDVGPLWLYASRWPSASPQEQAGILVAVDAAIGDLKAEYFTPTPAPGDALGVSPR